MVNRKDPVLEALRRANPATEESTRGWHASPEGERVAARAQAEAPERRVIQASPRPHRALIVLVAALTAALALAAGFAFGSRETLTPDTATCHAELQEGPGGLTVGLLGRDPITACTEEWRGAFGESAPTSLVVCVIDEGATGVYPNPEEMIPEVACSSIGANAYIPNPAAP